MNDAKCGRADPISRQGGWEADMHRYDVDVDAVVWNGTFLGETPVSMSGLPGILKIKSPNAHRISRTPSHLGAVLEYGNASLTRLVV